MFALWNLTTKIGLRGNQIKWSRPELLADGNSWRRDHRQAGQVAMASHGINKNGINVGSPHRLLYGDFAETQESYRNPKIAVLCERPFNT
jgi:hypothetical protein